MEKLTLNQKQVSTCCQLSSLARVSASVADSAVHSTRILEVNRWGSGAFLSVIPTSWDRSLRLEPQDFTENVRIRLGVELTCAQTLTNSMCKCGKTFDALGHHLMTCNHVCTTGGAYYRRHFKIQQTLAEECVKAVGPSSVTLEQELDGHAHSASTLRTDIKACGVIQQPNNSGTLHLDVTVVHPQSGSSLDNRAKQKLAKYEAAVLQLEGGTFLPFAVSTYGGLDTRAVQALRLIAEAQLRRGAASVHEPLQTLNGKALPAVLQRRLKRLVIAIHVGIIQAIRRAVRQAQGQRTLLATTFGRPARMKQWRAWKISELGNRGDYAWEGQGDFLQGAF
jgi:hypothetical protein